MTQFQLLIYKVQIVKNTVIENPILPVGREEHLGPCMKTQAGMEFSNAEGAGTSTFEYIKDAQDLAHLFDLDDDNIQSMSKDSHGRKPF